MKVCGVEVAADGCWHHVSATTSAGEPPALYVDGVRQGD